MGDRITGDVGDDSRNTAIGKDIDQRTRTEGGQFNVRVGASEPVSRQDIYEELQDIHTVLARGFVGMAAIIIALSIIFATGAVIYRQDQANISSRIEVLYRQNQGLQQQITEMKQQLFFLERERTPPYTIP